MSLARSFWGLVNALTLGSMSLSAQAVCGTPGKDGPGGTLSGIVNTYYPGLTTTASGAGAISRQVMGYTVIFGMLAASFIAIFLIPVTFYVVEKISHRKKAGPSAGAPGLSSPQGVGKGGSHHA